ncbi:hypothetical protein QVD17_41478 [Tagetes erecta]|uniref:CCR4-Not complex component Not1 C-terminal domain-containing protein n=1 Tax=Tagetes erecta TaxID=13708 RepID=A0AAD8NDP9_TARER|nr:hypothetical protein QVD17_41478 [Tagetes erecta]
MEMIEHQLKCVFCFGISNRSHVSVIEWKLKDCVAVHKILRTVIKDNDVVTSNYDVAVSTAVPRLDYIVVEASTAAQACVDMFRNNNLGIDLLAEISQSPRTLLEVDAALKAKQLKTVDEYLKTRPQAASFLSELKQKLLLSPSEAARDGTRYNVPLMNYLVLYVGIQLQARTPHGQLMASNASLAIFMVGAALDIFQALFLELDTEGRYLFLNVVANQLRYPNNHTHYFSFILIYLFSESNQLVGADRVHCCILGGFWDVFVLYLNLSLTTNVYNLDIIWHEFEIADGCASRKNAKGSSF